MPRRAGSVFPNDFSLQRHSARTHSAGFLTRGQRDAGSPARLDRGYFTPLPHTAGTGTAASARQTGSSRFGKGSWKARCSSTAALPEPGELRRGKKRKQLLVTYTEASRKRFQGHTGLRHFPCQVSYDRGTDHVQNQQNGPGSQDRRFFTPGRGSRGQEHSAASPDGEPARRRAGS